MGETEQWGSFVDHMISLFCVIFPLFWHITTVAKDWHVASYYSILSHRINLYQEKHIYIYYKPRIHISKIKLITYLENNGMFFNGINSLCNPMNVIQLMENNLENIADDTSI